MIARAEAAPRSPRKRALASRSNEGLGEILFEGTTSSGLRVEIVPKKGFEKKFAILGVRFGSIDREFRDSEAGRVSVPDGIAHFLEHCLFAEQSGDIFQRFAALGGAANAGTSFSSTSYVFGCSDRFEENLSTLLDFVANPWFEEKNVAKEMEIITQEIRMYRDSADWRVFMNLLEALYRKHPIRIDIAGTESSIRAIDARWLHLCYRNFYHPSNMGLFVAGDVDPEKTFRLVEKNHASREFGPPPRAERFFPAEGAAVARREVALDLPVATHKFLLGFKDAAPATGGREIARREAVTGILIDAALGRSSEAYESLYDGGLIDDTFSASYTADAGYGFTAIGGETDDPSMTVGALRKHLRRVARDGVRSEDFERIRSKALGKFYRNFNSPESVAYTAMHQAFRDTDILGFPRFLRSIRLDEINARAKEHFDARRSAVSLVRPRRAK